MSISSREFNFLNRNNISYGTVGTVVRDTNNIKQDISKINFGSLETKTRLDNLETKTILNKLEGINNVEGDTKIKGDLLISNQATGTNFLSVDPIQEFVGINTDEREIIYRDVEYSTTTSINNSKFMVHVQRNKYPVMVSERIQENADDTSMIQNILTATNEQMQQINSRYFGTYSGFTVKRKSNLYDFNELVKCSNILDTQNKISKPLDKVTNLRYGADMSFEVCDKTNRTVELIDLQGTIDSITPEGFLKCGFGVQVNDLTLGGNNSFDSTRRNLMYVDNSGTLFINKINLNGVALENIDGKLFWGGKEVVTK